MAEWQRFSAVEYSRPTPLIQEISQGFRIPRHRAEDLVIRSAVRIRRLLRLEASPVSWTEGGLQFQNIAGILLVAPQLELEIAPKFLGNSPGWREDFFLLATLSAHGRLLDREGLSSSSHETSDLATLIGRNLVEMFNQNRRRPLRTYRRLPHTAFSIDGDFEPEELSVPDEDGFDQEVTTFTSDNSYNATIGGAALRLSTIVPDVETRARLERMARTLPSRRSTARLRDRRLPSRSRSWQPAYDLAVDILRGFGGTFDPKNLFAPGFVVKTWQIWEDLVSWGLRLGFGAKQLSLQRRYRLGSRCVAGRESAVNVRPDAVLNLDAGSRGRLVIVDSKYKGNVDRLDRSVATSDIYEALAFSRATGIGKVTLVYPMMVGTKQSVPARVGHASTIASICMDDTQVRAIEVGVCGISRTGGLGRFARSLRSEVCKMA